MSKEIKMKCPKCGRTNDESNEISSYPLDKLTSEDRETIARGAMREGSSFRFRLVQCPKCNAVYVFVE
jgi:DNA-directed RNA polymerase subunit M/transcription elongation factor TFIIS